jgi:hypothetical protein
MNRERKHGAVRLRRVLRCAGPLLLAVSAGAQAQEQQASWAFDLGARYSDNIGRVDVNEESETVGIAGLSFAFDIDRRRLDARAAADLRYLHYLDSESTFDDEINGGLEGVLSLAFVPERLVWVAEENYGQVARNRQVADNPDNRQDINYFSTGPDLTLPFGARTTFQVSGRWADAYYEAGDQDSESLTGSAALIRQISEAVALSLNGTYSEIDFDQDETFVDYTIEQAFLRLTLTGARTTLTLDGGGSRLEQEDDSAKSESALARLDLTRQVGSRSSLRLTVGTQPSNSAQTFRRDQELGGVEVGGPDSAVVSGDSFQSDYGYLSFTTDWERSSFTAFLSARQEDHEVFSELDREQYRATVNYSRDLTRNLSVDLRGTYLDEKFTETGFAFDQWGAGIGMRWQLGRQFSLRATVDRFVGSSDDGSRDYTENRAYIGISYSSETNE